MTEKVEIDKLVLVEKLLIPMQNISLMSRFITEGKSHLSQSDLLAGFEKIRINAERISLYLISIKDGVHEEPTLRLPSLIQEHLAECIAQAPEVVSSSRNFLLHDLETQSTTKTHPGSRP